MTTDAACVAVARRWFRLLGTETIDAGAATIVATPVLPDVWDANFVLAAPDARPDEILAASERYFAHSDWRVVTIDALTPPAIEAALALAGYEARDALVEMLATGPITSRHALPAIEIRPVDDETTRAALVALIRADHAEGARTGPVSEAVSEGLIATMLTRTPPARYDLIVSDDEAIGYGLTAACPGGLGLIEHLFTRPVHRGRGLMSAFITGAVARLRTAGCDGVFLDAHADDTPKHLYAALGFAPVALSRTWVRDMRRPSP